MSSPPSRSFLRVAAFACALLAAGPIMAATEPQLASADTAYKTAAELPEQLNATSVVWAGNYAYVFGGVDGSYWNPSTDIVRFDPSTNDVVTLPAKLPFHLDYAGAAWDGRDVYVFGGRTRVPHIDGRHPMATPSYEILKFDPRTEVITTLPEKLPLASCPTHAVWTGKTFLVFGTGKCGMSTLWNEIMSFDPADRSITVLNSRLPAVAHVGGAGGFFDGEHAYIFSSSSSDVSVISKLDPFNDTIETLTAKLPFTCSASSAFDGHDAYIFGGIPCNDPTDFRRSSRDIVRFNPQTEEVTIMRSQLPTRRLSTAAFSNGTDFFVVGGITSVEPGLSSSPLDWFWEGPVTEIVRFSPVPAAPTEFSAINRADGEVELKWTPPATNTYGWPIQYNIYRSTQIEELRVAQVPGDQTSYIDNCPLAQVCRYRVTAFNRSGEGESTGPSAAFGLSR